MALAPLVGHADLRATLSRAISSGTLPQVLLISGPPGVGKQRLALWIAQRLVCQTPGPVEPCGRCGSCLRVLGLAHPDVQWLMPIPRPKAAEADKQVEESAEAIEAILAERRIDPLWGQPDGMSLHGIASARLVLRQAAMTSVEGGAKVFLIAHADRLVPQESSPEGANALLKLLEEPSPRSFFLLTTTTPGQVLPTIRSRAVPVRVGRLADSEVAEFLRAHRPELATDAVVSAAHGSIGSALAKRGDAGAKADGAATAWLEAVSKGTSSATERALRQGPWAARGDFTLLLDALAVHLVEDARSSLHGHAGRDPAAIMAAVERVAVARERAQGNVNPQLLLAVLGDELSSLGVV